MSLSRSAWIGFDERTRSAMPWMGGYEAVTNSGSGAGTAPRQDARII